MVLNVAGDMNVGSGYVESTGCLFFHTMSVSLIGRKTAAISRVAKQTILMRRAQKNEQERQPIFVLHAIKHGYDGHKKSPNSL